MGRYVKEWDKVKSKRMSQKELEEEVERLRNRACYYQLQYDLRMMQTFGNRSRGQRRRYETAVS